MELIMAQFDKSETEQKVIQIIADTLSIEKATIKPDSTFEKLGADSLDMFEIIMKFEEEFGIEIDDDEAAKITSLADAVDKVHALRTK